jgi:hypothetical protein
MAQSQTVADPTTWSRARSKRTGQEVYVVPSRTKPNVAHWVGVNRYGLIGCTCTGYRRRGHCAHADALRAYEQRTARENGLASESEIDCHLAGLRADHDAEAAALRRRRYDDLFPADEFETATAHTVGGG